MSILSGILITLIFLGIFISPIIGIIAGPKIQWNNQMKDSCEYFDTRISMGTHFPESQYNIRSLDQSVHDQTFFLAPVFAPQADITAKYQYYHRFSGNTANTAHLAIDVDLENAIWRMMELDGPDERTKWAAVGRKRDNAALPAFENVNQTVIYNGTIEQLGPHLWIPDFMMLIQGIDDARQHCEIEPFIRVFDVQGAPIEYYESLIQPKWNWSPEWDEYLMMRTASFGLGRQRLDMCVRENNFRTFEFEEDKYKGVSDISFVPLAIIASYRMRFSEIGRLDCSKDIMDKARDMI
ncbi:hypothetical protein EYC80_006581 [Monilinia laxa]|uniref:Uncharacterized protein n=1 Tax=Monilinia laxa TaxID=61186 RepID=A0A5N6JU77_MONLA|nr:hypothetical protein EYC80_006581 [Monilinia laxa]